MNVKKMACLAGLLGVMALSGCLESTTTIAVRKDGSGAVMETTYFGKGLQQMMEQMAGMGAEAGAASPTSTIDIEKCKARAAQLGEGVRFVSAREAAAPDGRKGQKVVYAFDDITTLGISPDPDTPGPGEQPGKEKSRPITFGFEKGSVSTLTINMPEAPAKMDEVPIPVDEPAAEPPPAQLAQMQQMFDGFRVHIMIKVGGEIKETNATHVHKARASGKNQYVTLFDVNIGELMKNADNMKQLAAMGPMQNMAEAAAKLQDFPGLRVEPAQRVEIKFQ